LEEVAKLIDEGKQNGNEVAALIVEPVQCLIFIIIFVLFLGW